MRNGWLVPVGAVAAMLVIAACGSSSSSTGGSGGGSGSSPAASSGTTLSTMKIGSATVLTNSKGFTLYWFAPDTSTTSKCTGSCAKYWPPVPGPATAGDELNAPDLRAGRGDVCEPLVNELAPGYVK